LFSIVEDAKEELDRIAGPTLDALEMMLNLRWQSCRVG
jgi:hypothetical protein